MKFFIVLICSFLICVNTSAQGNLLYKGSQINYYKVDSDFVAIMQRPVTNREYIIYIQWMRGVFGPNYPELYYKSIPGFDMDTLKKEYELTGRYDDALNNIINCSEPFLKEYIFNPKYLDYPVVGVSWQNANNYGKWLADRYNENKLIKTDYLNYSPTPTEQDYFSTDTYIAGLWQGQVKRFLKTNDKANPERRFEWSDNIFIPAFRLPTKLETKQTYNEIIEFKPYPFSKKHFLYRWYKQYFASESDTLLELWTYKEQNPTPEKIVCNKKFAINITGELKLELNNKTNTNNLTEIYNQNQQLQVVVDKNNEKFSNSYFDLREATTPFPFVIISEDKNKKPIYVTHYKNLEPANKKEFKVFRLACSATPAQLGVKIK